MFRFRRITVVAIPLAVTIAILYALAAGPLVYMERIGRPVLSVEAFLWIYEPLNRAEARFQPVGATMQFYIDFWERAAKRHLDTKAKKRFAERYCNSIALDGCYQNERIRCC